MIIKILVITVLSSFVLVICQDSLVCEVDIGFPTSLPWITRSSCTLPADSNIAFDFMNVSDISMDGPYLLVCSGNSVSIDASGVTCTCRYSFYSDPSEFLILDGLECQGFVLGASSYETPISTFIIVGIIITLITIILVLLLILCIIAGYRVFRRKNRNIRSRDSQNAHLVTATSIPLQTIYRREDDIRYSEINFSDYDYIDMNVELFYSASFSNNSEALYERIRRGVPSADSKDTIEDQLRNIRRIASRTNRLGAVSHIVVPTSEQRNSIRSEMSPPNSMSFRDYARFNSPHKSSVTSISSLVEQIYLEPSSDVGELYNQMSNEKLMEINRDTIAIGSKLGSGEFGDVSSGVWSSPIGDLDVALKIMNKTDEQTKTAFLQEAAILGQFSHPNILRLVGVVTLTAPNMIVTELMHEELKRFLISLQTQHKQDLDYSTIAPHFLSFSRQVASGMQHLAQRGCIHRDIAARNILLTDKCVCKIGDFGMSRRLGTESDYYKVKGSNKLPVKWSAPEAIFFKRYTLKSDVWSYGMLLYEIWSVGRKPWPYEDNRSAVEKMARAVNLSPPAGCPRPLYQLMVGTWHPKADHRPDMDEVVSRLSLPDEELLARPELEGKVTANTPAFTLGSDPMAADELYKDLQDLYVNLGRN